MQKESDVVLVGVEGAGKFGGLVSCVKDFRGSRIDSCSNEDLDEKHLRSNVDSKSRLAGGKNLMLAD